MISGSARTTERQPGEPVSPRAVYTAYRTIHRLRATRQHIPSTIFKEDLEAAMITMKNVTVAYAAHCTAEPSKFCWCDAWEAMLELEGY